MTALPQRLGRSAQQNEPDGNTEALRKIAFDEYLKIHDLVLGGVDLVPKRRGYWSIESRGSAKRHGDDHVTA
jgi:hypothetical protein